MEHPVKKYYAVVIGGVNMDIGGSPAGRLVMRDSNPGLVTLKPGGVGRASKAERRQRRAGRQKAPAMPRQPAVNHISILRRTCMRPIPLRRAKSLPGTASFFFRHHPRYVSVRLPPDRQDIPIRHEGSASARRINALNDTCFPNRREGTGPKKRRRACVKHAASRCCG